MTASIRYIVNELDPAVAFYEHLGFATKLKPGPGFAMLQRDGLTLYLNTPEGGGGAGQALADGSVPAPGGWNRFQLEVDDVTAEIERLSAEGVTFRSGVIEGRGGKQVLAQDPSGNRSNSSSLRSSPVSGERVQGDRRSARYLRPVG